MNVPPDLFHNSFMDAPISTGYCIVHRLPKWQLINSLCLRIFIIFLTDYHHEGSPARPVISFSCSFPSWSSQTRSFFISNLQFMLGCSRCCNTFSSLHQALKIRAVVESAWILFGLSAPRSISASLVVRSPGSWSSCIINAGSSHRSSLRSYKTALQHIWPVRGGDVRWGNEAVTENPEQW